MVSKCANYVTDVIGGVCILPTYAGDIVSQTSRTVTALAFTALSVLTLGLVDKFNEAASIKRTSVLILPTAFQGVIAVFNVGAHKYDKVEQGSFRSEFRLFDKALDCTQRRKSSKLSGRVVNFMIAQVGSRLLFALAAVVATIIRVVDLIIGVIAAALSIICLGHVEKLNKLALDNLTILGVINDLSNGIRGFVNPFQSNLECYRSNLECFLQKFRV